MPHPPVPEVLTVRTHGYDVLRPAIQSGELKRIRRGAYMRLAPDEAHWAARQREVLARCRAVSERVDVPFAFSHQTAALLHGWPVTLHNAQVHLTQAARPTRCGRGDLVRHTVQALPDHDLLEVHGMPVTSLERTLLDCARALPPLDGLIVCDGAFGELASMSVFDRESAEARQDDLRAALLERIAALGPARHVVRARAVLTYAHGLAASPGESWMRWLALVTGLPEPVLQWEVWRDGSQYFTDLAWPGEVSERLVVAEYDGAAKYGDGPSVVLEEKIREDRIREAGAAVVRFSAADMRKVAVARSRLLAAFPPAVRRALVPRPALATRVTAAL